jgi:nickel/cobalt exporter
VGAVRLSAVALASSLAQGATAVLLVGAGVWLLNWSREYMTDLADRLLQPLGFAAIAAIGLWLVYRGARDAGRCVPRNRRQSMHGHGHDHGHGQCGHAHAPAAEQVAAATSTRELLALIGAVAIRPCTGAIFLLILTAQMGVFIWGIAGTIAMALGTASVTIGVALAAVFLRQGALAGLSGQGGTAGARAAGAGDRRGPDGGLDRGGAGAGDGLRSGGPCGGGITPGTKAAP